MKKKEITQSKVEETKPAKEEKKKIGRPTILTPELKTKLIKLFEEHFFLKIVSAEADVYEQRIIEWKRELEAFRNDVTHAQAKWIRQQMKLLDEYAKDKKTKDWRALKYKLSIADAEYNDKKFLREAPGKRESTQITIIIDRRDLETSKKEAYKLIGEAGSNQEKVSLIPFEEKKEKKPEKSGKKGKPGEAETL